jgi:hypothetical protein
MDTKPTRRSFFGKAGAVLAAPLAATAGPATAADDRADIATRLAWLEDSNAIRALLPGLLASPARLALDATIRSVAADGEATIALAADGTATVLLGCSVEAAAPIVGGDTFIEMARLQGDGFVVRQERRVLATSFVKRDGIWQFSNAELQA